MIPYFNGVMECWRSGVMVEMKDWLVNLFLSNTPSLHYSITPLLQSVKDSSHEKFRI